MARDPTESWGPGAWIYAAFVANGLNRGASHGQRFSMGLSGVPRSRTALMRVARRLPVRVARSGTPLLTDVLTPRMSGRQLAERLLPRGTLN